MATAYVCLACGSKTGEPASADSANWYWRILEHGRIGPFDSLACSTTFSLSGDGLFTLEQWERLRWIRFLYREDPLADQAVKLPMHTVARLP